MRALAKRLNEIEAQGYKAYKRLQGEFEFPDFRLCIDHVQGDPFAEPSRCRVLLPVAATHLAPQLFDNAIRKIALEDFLGRRFAAAIDDCVAGNRGSGRSGEVEIAPFGQQVLERSCLTIQDAMIEVRFQLGLPANNRRIDAGEARIMLFEELPVLVESALLRLDDHEADARRQVDSVEDQQYLRDQLDSRGLIAFIAEGSNLARRSGVDDRPLTDAVRIQAPESIAIELPRLHHPPIKGLALPKGINLIVGGGFHGKSTLLRAIEQGIYDHIPGDGRECVVSDPSCFKLQAEDGRAVAGVDIRPFIENLPADKDCSFFTTENASGSSSQAASIIEALSTGVQTLLIDEDSSASNFLIRDRRMQLLVPKEKEPITPLSQRIRQMRDQTNISTVMVMGGSGDYFSLADRVVMMDNYQPRDLTLAAHDLAESDPVPESDIEAIKQHSARIARTDSLSALGPSGKPRIKAFATRLLQFGSEDIPLEALAQLVDSGQLLTIGYLIEKFRSNDHIQGMDLVAGLEQVYAQFRQEGFDSITPYPMGKLALPRLQELVAVVNHMRMLKLKPVYNRHRKPT